MDTTRYKDGTKSSGQTKTYKAWADMKQRCNNPNCEMYPHYGGRGISYDPAWESFDAFFKDMGHAPAGKSLDRKDNDKNYTADNCVWATELEQHQHTSRVVLLEYQGQTRTIAGWARQLGLSRSAIYWRLDNGWSVDKTLSTLKTR